MSCKFFSSGTRSNFAALNFHIVSALLYTAMTPHTCLSPTSSLARLWQKRKLFEKSFRLSLGSVCPSAYTTHLYQGFILFPNLSKPQQAMLICMSHRAVGTLALRTPHQYKPKNSSYRFSLYIRFKIRICQKDGFCFTRNPQARSVLDPLEDHSP